MGRNRDIKRFDARKTGQPVDLFESAQGRKPVVLELLSSPWVKRASELPSGDASGKRVDVPVTVDWDADRGRPAWFEHRGSRYTVDAVVQQWAVERGWWDGEEAVSRRCFRVLARGGVFDLAYERNREEWFLVGVVD